MQTPYFLKLFDKLLIYLFPKPTSDDIEKLLLKDEVHFSPKALVENTHVASKNILEMLDSSSIKCLSGKKLKCNIDSICIHGDNKNAIEITKKIISTLKDNGIKLVNLDKLKRIN